MKRFETNLLPEAVDDIAPDGSEVRLLSRVERGSMMHCRLPAGTISKPVYNQTVDELWYVIEGRGRMWRKQGDHEAIIDLHQGVSLTLPARTYFQFRAEDGQALCMVITTMPPWPGEDENVYLDKGVWEFDDGRS